MTDHPSITLPSAVAADRFAELSRPSAEAWAQLDARGATADDLGGGWFGEVLAEAVAECRESIDPGDRRAERDTPSLARARTEFHQGEGLAFARVVIEVVRRRALDLALADPLATWSAMIELLDRPELMSGMERERHQALHGLVFAYLADEHRVLGEHRQAEQYLVSASRIVDGGHDSEIRATVLEIRAELHNEQGRLASCEADLDRALAVLDAEHHRVSGRRSQALYRRGRLAYRHDRFDDAVRFLEAARRDLPGALDLRLRIDLLHLLAFAHGCLNQNDAADDCLRAIDRLPATYDTPRLAGQRNWLRGRLSARAGRWTEADDALRRAVVALAEAGLIVESLRSFTALADVLARRDRLPAELPALRALFRRTYRREHFADVRAQDIERLVGADDAELSQYLRELLATPAESVQ